MIRFILRSLLFLIVACSFITAMIYAASITKYNEKGSILRQVTGNPVKKGGDTFLRFYEAENNTKPVDIMVIGSSRAFRAFDPTIFEKHGLNIQIIASSSQTALNTYYLTRKYLSKLKPKMVIFDIHLGLLNNNGLESFFDLCTNTPISPELYEMALAIDQPNTYTAIQASLINQLDTPIYQGFEFKAPKGYRKGFLSSFVTDTTLTINPIDTAMEKRKLYPQELKNIGFVEKTIQFILDQNVQLVLTRQPVLAPETFNSQRRIRRIAMDHNLKYIDLNRYIDRFDPKHDFYNRTHINSHGAVLVSEIVIEELRKTGNFNGIVN